MEALCLHYLFINNVKTILKWHRFIWLEKYKNPKTINILKKNEKFVITINREVGSGGRTVGRILAEKLGVSYYDKALIQALEEKYKLTSDEIERLKSRSHSWWSDFKRVMIVGEDAANSAEYYVGAKADLLTTEALFQAEKEILQGIAQEESCVIAGRSAFFVLNGHPNRLSIFIQASMEYRMNRIMRKRSISSEEAMNIIHKVDQLREDYVRNYAQTSRYDSRNYDLVINMDGKTEEEVANLILSYIN